ncbi:hypothetical protein CL622_08200 [archaeon]|nr:hypothetical protein [archaeon]|tara:strand:- start:4 stop:747 length:744 start_codon:yes stop_codon:yes gene_type:complete
MNLKELRELGLSDGQISVYSAVLDLGISSLNKIQEKTGIERRHIYDVLNKLIERGFITYTIEKGKRTYQCTHPNSILDEVKEKEQSLKELKGKIPQMKSLFTLTKPEIRAEIFRGNESIKALMNESLEYKESYWIGGNSGIESTPLKYWFKHWMEKRVKNKHMLNDLVDHGVSLIGLEPRDIKKHKKNYYKYCTLPKNMSSPMVILIFGNKVAQILWGDQSFAFVLESDKIKDSFMKYFNHFWTDPW